MPQGLTRVGSLFSFAMLLAAGCAQEDTTWQQVQPLEDYSCRRTQEDVTVAVKCWSSASQRRKLFRGDPGSEILPVQLVIYNKGQSPVRFSRTRAELELPDGTVLRPLPTSAVSSRLQHGDAAAAVINILTLGYGGGIAGIVSGATEKENRKRRQATRTCSMELATIDPGEVMTGFVFFELPDGARNALRNGVEARFRITHLPRPDGEALAFAMGMPLEEPSAPDQPG